MVLRHSDARIRHATANYNGFPFFAENNPTMVGTDPAYRKLLSRADV